MVIKGSVGNLTRYTDEIKVVDKLPSNELTLILSGMAPAGLFLAGSIIKDLIIVMVERPRPPLTLDSPNSELISYAMYLGLAPERDQNSVFLARWP